MSAWGLQESGELNVLLDCCATAPRLALLQVHFPDMSFDEMCQMEHSISVSYLAICFSAYRRHAEPNCFAIEIASSAFMVADRKSSERPCRRKLWYS
jgi:hypothetical protein